MATDTLIICYIPNEIVQHLNDFIRRNNLPGYVVANSSPNYLMFLDGENDAAQLMFELQFGEHVISRKSVLVESASVPLNV
jgi:hypothetical protein